MTGPAHGDTSLPMPVVECKRCRQRFVCDQPELSGAVECPHCLKTAWLSSAHQERVRLAASEQLRDGSYNGRFHGERSNVVRASAMSHARRASLEAFAKGLRADAIETCPACTYDLRGVLDGDELTNCPECGEQTSRPINAMLWGERGRDARMSRWIVRWWCYPVAAWMAVVPAVIGLVFGYLDAVAFLLAFTTIGVIVATPVLVFVNGCRWKRMMDPVGSGFRRIGFAISMAAYHTLVVVGGVYLGVAISGV